LAKILVVDDDVAVQMTIRLLLERAGHSVVVAGDGRKGLAIFETGEFDLLFLDIFMPGMDGLETMRLVPAAAPDPDHRDIGQSRHFRFRFRPGFPDHGHQARRGPEPAETLQAGRAAGGRCRFP